MPAVAQPLTFARRRSFGIADPSVVTDLSKVPLFKPAVEEQGAEPAAVAYTYSERVEMSAADWAKVPDNKRQRDTIKHSKKAKHLHRFDPVHQFVNMARLPNGDCIKLDGHTRSHLWSSGQVKGPESVIVDIYDCEDLGATMRLYGRFDSQGAVENGSDKVAGAARQHKLEFTTPLLVAGRYSTALRRLYIYRRKGVSTWTDSDLIYDAVGFYRGELLLLDQVGAKPADFPTGVIMGALATFKRRGKLAMPFWTEYAKGGGEKSDGVRDAVQTLSDAVLTTRLKTMRAEGGGALQQNLFGKSILAVEAYLKGQTYQIGKGSGLRQLSDQALRLYIRRSNEG